MARLLLLPLLLLASAALGDGKLEAFEAGARKPAAVHAAAPRGDDGGATSFDDDDDDLDDLLWDVLGLTLFYGGAGSWERVTATTPTDEGFAPRRAGEALIPFLRADVAWQDVESDVAAVDLRAEAGFGPFAAHFDQTRYMEDVPDDDLALTRVLGLYRMSFGSCVEADLGFGALTIAGEDTDSRFLFAAPVLIHPSRWWGVELRPAWASQVADYDLTLLLGSDYASLKAGYRWTRTTGESLDGPYVGLALRF